jgi:hypothetical protein
MKSAATSWCNRIAAQRPEIRKRSFIKCAAADQVWTSVQGHLLPPHSTLVPANVRYASNSDHSKRESELTLCAMSRHSFTRRVSLDLSFFELNPAEMVALLEPSLAHAFEEFWHLVGRIGDVLLDPRDRDIQLQFP